VAGTAVLGVDAATGAVVGALVTAGPATGAPVVAAATGAPVPAAPGAAVGVDLHKWHRNKSHVESG
jgi:hypothetical protein